MRDSVSRKLCENYKKTFNTEGAEATQIPWIYGFRAGRICLSLMKLSGACVTRATWPSKVSSGFIRISFVAGKMLFLAPGFLCQEIFIISLVSLESDLGPRDAH